MNTSMMDTYNLGWKLASVIHGTAQPSVLSTCKSSSRCNEPPSETPPFADNTERHAVANDLIEFDRKIAGLFSGKPATREEVSTSCKVPPDDKNAESTLKTDWRFTGRIPCPLEEDGQMDHWNSEYLQTSS